MSFLCGAAIVLLRSTWIKRALACLLQQNAEHHFALIILVNDPLFEMCEALLLFRAKIQQRCEGGHMRDIN